MADRHFIGRVAVSPIGWRAMCLSENGAGRRLLPFGAGKTRELTRVERRPALIVRGGQSMMPVPVQGLNRI